MSYLLSVPVAGFLGLHQYYVKRYLFGFFYTFTGGLCGIGPLVDLFRMKKYVNEANEPSIILGVRNPQKKNLVDAYQLWFPLGWLGLHHIYLQNYLKAFAYFLSFGIWGFGFLLDGFRMKRLVEEANKEKQEEGLKKLTTAYMCWFPFGGFIGLHHYYLCFGPHHFHPRRLLLAILYTCTFGLFGIGWMADIILLRKAVNKINNEIGEKISQKEQEEAVRLARHIEEQEELAAVGRAHRELQEEQDLEFVKALSRDQEIDRQKEEERIQKEQEEEIALTLKEKAKQEREDYIQKKLNEIPPEPQHSEDTINLVFRLSNGQRIQRRFQRIDKLQLVRDWLDLQKKVLKVGADNDFTIETAFPKKVYAEYNESLEHLFPNNQMLSVMEVTNV